jgi:hypothetical protein
MTKPMNHDKEEEVQTKGIENIFNKIKNFSNLDKDVVIQVQETFRTPSRQH